jgi:putative ABC transport system permease protein
VIGGEPRNACAHGGGQRNALIHAGVLLTSVGFSALVGIRFGLFPARKAASLDPIEALRFE